VALFLFEPFFVVIRLVVATDFDFDFYYWVFIMLLLQFLNGVEVFQNCFFFLQFFFSSFKRSRNSVETF